MGIQVVGSQVVGIVLGSVQFLVEGVECVLVYESDVDGCVMMYGDCLNDKFEGYDDYDDFNL